WQLDNKGTLIEKTVGEGHLSAVYGAVFAPDGKMLATGSQDATVRLWDLSVKLPKKETTLFPTKGVLVHSVAYSPDSKTLAAGGHDGVIIIYDTAPSRELRRLTDNPGHVSQVLFTPDGKRLVARAQKTMVLWDVSERREIRRFEGHEPYVNAMDL